MFGPPSKGVDSDLVVLYNNCMTQHKADEPDKRQIEDFRRHLRVLEREVVRQLAQETGCCGVTVAQCHALLELAEGERSLSALAAALDLDVSTLSRTVEGMVRCGFVDRRESAGDRRAVRLRLTDAGRHKVAVINGTCNRYYAGLLGELDEKDRRYLFRAIRLLGDLMRHKRAKGPDSCCDARESQSQGRPQARKKVKPHE